MIQQCTVAVPSIQEHSTCRLDKVLESQALHNTIPVCIGVSQSNPWGSTSHLDNVLDLKGSNKKTQLRKVADW